MVSYCDQSYVKWSMASFCCYGKTDLCKNSRLKCVHVQFSFIFCQSTQERAGLMWINKSLGKEDKERK